MAQTIEVTSDAIRSMDIAKIFKDHDSGINALSFTDDSQYLLTSGDDKRLGVYKVDPGVLHKTKVDTTYGTALVTATHHNSACLYTNGCGEEHVVMYYNLTREAGMWTMREHQADINCISVSPSSDIFLSTSVDGKLYSSDLRQRRPIATCDFARDGIGYAAFDPTGVVYGLVHPEEGKTSIKLYDTRNAEVGPFKTKSLENCKEVHGFEFSDDGNLALVQVSDSQIRLLDSMTLNSKQTLTGFTTPAGKTAAFSACSKYVLVSCAASRTAKVYEADSGREIHALRHESPACSLAWSREYFLVATASNWLILWVPDLARSQK